MKQAAAGAVSLAAATTFHPRAYAAGSDRIRVGLIGCGGRGTHDIGKCLQAADGVELTAMGDMFPDRLQRCRQTLTSRPRQSRKGAAEEPNLADKVKVTDDKCFTGWDAHLKVLATDVDLVILTEPPHFRPAHLKAAIAAGKHVFMEKPVAVDPAGVRSVIQTSELADQKGLTIVAGTQMRRISHVVEAVKRIQDGALGEILGGQCVRLGDAMRSWGPKERESGWSDMEWQLRRWLFMTWLSGDFIVEMHVHNIDMMNWLVGAHPVQCLGMGGRQARTEPEYGDSFDHFAVEYEYPNGLRVEYMGAQIDKMSDRNDQRLAGTKGSLVADFAGVRITGQNPVEIAWDKNDPCVKQHADQIEAIRRDQRLNEGRRIAESTLTSIMGRMSAYTGRALKWDWALNASKLDLTPPAYEFGKLPMPPVAVPGQTQLI
ncbi:MAG: Gfo/Idh/MocA family oxidoreductase [Planctomycetes bacterium]|jgi:predicted dehydrogenase|nr:Gfo/Idh/MocA family oxidoreductase [Planctomycetota bacterium]